MSVLTLVSCNGRRRFQACTAYLPLPDHHAVNAARYEALRAGWSMFGDKDYCPSCTMEQAQRGAS